MHANRKLLMAAALALASAAAWAQGPYRMTLSGASPSGLWTILGVGIDGAVKASFPGSTITYQTSGGGFANIALLDQGKVELGLAHDAELRVAQQGGKPFTKPVTSLRAIALMYDWAPMQMVMRSPSFIATSAWALPRMWPASESVSAMDRVTAVGWP